MIRLICKWIVFKWIYPICYHAGCLRKIRQKKIIFVENHAEQLSDNFLLLKEAFEERDYEISTHYLRISTSGWGKVVLRSIRLIWDMAAAKCVFLCDSNSIFGAFTLRPQTKLVQLWHACGAFKKWGYSIAEKEFGDNKKTLDTFPGHKNYDLVSVSGADVCWAYEEAFGLKDRPGVVQALGVSRTDIYFQEEKKQQAYSHLEKSNFPLQGRRIILYAPTFRGDIQTARTPDGLDLGSLYSLQEEYLIFIKQHPFVKRRMTIPEEYQDFCIEITDELSMEELLMVSDICVTDYSSIVFEYALLGKPILFFACDLEEYYDERGFYYPYEEFVPGPVVRTTEELLQEIERIAHFDKDRIEDFRKQYMSGCDGHSTERIMEYVLG